MQIIQQGISPDIFIHNMIVVVVMSDDYQRINFHAVKKGPLAQTRGVTSHQIAAIGWGSGPATKSTLRLRITMPTDPPSYQIRKV